MPTGQISEVVRHLRTAVLTRDGAGRTDGELLEDYLSRRDESAVAALVRRHGPMVWSVCRRVLRHEQDAEDAFQATFLVSFAKAAIVMPREMIGNWLYGVAYQTALKAKANATRRSMRERQVSAMPEPTVVERERRDDVHDLLDQELNRLPNKYRAVLLLCDLDNRTRREAARQLGCPEGTVAGRLARARALLARRLARRGLVLPSAALAAMVTQATEVPAGVASATIQAAAEWAAGTATASMFSTRAAVLMEGVLRAMRFTRLKRLAALVLIVALLVSAAGFFSQTPAAELEKIPATNHLPDAIQPDANPALADAKDQKQFRQLTFRAHLKGKLAAEPKVEPGETILVVPDPAEPFSSHKTVQLTLPVKVPAYQGEFAMYYLYGYAVGWTGCINGQFDTHSNVSEARVHESWNKGWADGWEAAEKARKPMSKIPWGPEKNGVRCAVTLSNDNEKLHAGESVRVLFHTKNFGAKGVTVITEGHPLYVYKLSVLGPDGTPTPLTAFGKQQTEVAGDGSKGTDKLTPGQASKDELLLSRIYDLTRTGEYKISFTRMIFDAAPDPIAVTSNVLTITVLGQKEEYVPH